MGDKSIYIIVKLFYEQGCLAYKCKTINEARCLPGSLEAIRGEDVQIVVLNSPDIYPEYAPYMYTEDVNYLIDYVNKSNKSA